MKIQDLFFDSEPIEMKKIFRRSQMKDVLGRRVSGPQRHLFGLPYDGASGTFFPENPDSMDLMFAAAEKYYPEIHIVSEMENRYSYNRYVENAYVYHLYRGDTDPDIEFTNEWSDNDFTPEEFKRQKQLWEQMLKEPPTEADIAAVNWMIENIKSKSSKKSF